jgi:hypothetical protein
VSQALDTSPIESAMKRLAEMADAGRDMNRLQTVEDRRWAGTVATDGHIAIATTRWKRGGASPYSDSLAKWLSEDNSTWRVLTDVAALREWCGTPVWPGPGQCPTCEGRGKGRCDICSGKGECSNCQQGCPECLGSGAFECEPCEGKGQVKHLPVVSRAARIGEQVVVDRVFLGRVLEAMEDGEVEISGTEPKEAIKLRQGDVIALVMPMNVPSVFWPEIEIADSILNPTSIDRTSSPA